MTTQPIATVEWMRWVSDNQLELQVWIAVAAIVLWIIYSPYRLFRESQRELEKEKSARLTDLQTLDKRITEYTAELDRRDLNQRCVNVLSIALRDGVHMLRHFGHPEVMEPTREDVNNWGNRTVAPILRELGYGYHARFEACEMAPHDADDLTKRKTWLQSRVSILEKFIEELTPKA